jgi:major membrane immunogen (membrane-anchored lipoprotein)
MKQLIFFVLLTTLLFGCSQKETPPAIPQQNMDANHTYLDAKITDFKVEDGKYTVHFEAWDRGPIKAKASTTENLYKGLQDYHKVNKEMTYDIIIDGDDTFILGAAPSDARHYKSINHN